MSNFQFLLSDPGFHPFAEVAMAAEKILHIDPAAAILNCRRAMEFAVKWMYSVDKELELPYQDNLLNLMTGETFRTIIGPDLWQRMDLIRKKGNTVAHSVASVSENVAMACLENLHIFLDFVAYCYTEDHQSATFDPTLVPRESSLSPAGSRKNIPGLDPLQLLEENRKLKEQLTARRTQHQKSYLPKPLDISEYETRKFYIDAMLEDAGWIEGLDWRNEVELPGTAAFADYVLYDDDSKPLAIIEAKRSCMDARTGSQQAALYADILEQAWGFRPVIFLTNGFETHILDGQYPERKCAAIYSKQDLLHLFQMRSLRRNLESVSVKTEIADRYYQIDAIRSVCKAFQENRRNALLVMASGSGKTRTVIGLCDVLRSHGWVQNILFLANRSTLVSKAKRSFESLLPQLRTVNLCNEKEPGSSNCVFATYQTMMQCIDTLKGPQGKLFTCGHFDLVICDEVHPAIYRKYRDLFHYFDAPLVGLTASPAEEIDQNIYDLFAPGLSTATYRYELPQAVNDGYLVDFMAIRTPLSFTAPEATYDELDEADRNALEATFATDSCDLPDKIISSALNEWVFNSDTIRQAIHVLMEEGLHIHQGKTLGKTILFAVNLAHAEKIRKIFDQEFPQLPGFARVIDSSIDGVQQLIDDFSNPGKLPQIAISTDLLDTGIDIPECLNLVFFRKVMSKAKFRQMLGRGARPCRGLQDGKDKDTFYIFDFCGNLDFFRIGHSTGSSLWSSMFRIKAQLTFLLQGKPELEDLRHALVEDMVRHVQALDRESFAVRQHLKYVELYANPNHYTSLTRESTLKMASELAPLIRSTGEDAQAVRFDTLIYGMELAYLLDKESPKARADLLKHVRSLNAQSHIPEIAPHKNLIHQILQPGYLESAGVMQYEQIRKNLRDLIHLLPGSKIRYTSNFSNAFPSI